MNQRLLRSFALCTLVLAAAFTSAATRQETLQQTEAPAVDEGPLVAPGDAPDFTLIYTGGVVGYVEPCG